MQAAPRTDPRIVAGIVALAAIALLIGGAFLGLLAEGARDMSGAASAFDPYLFRVARFTLWQAALSTVLSIVPAIFVARALSRHPDFPGRRLILRLLRPATGVAGDRRGARHSGAVRPGRLFRRLNFCCVRLHLARHLRPVGHSRRPCLLQPAAGDEAFSRDAGYAASGSVAAGEPARHGRRPVVPADRMAGDPRRPARRRWPRLHALHHLLHHHTDAWAADRPRPRWKSRSIRRCVSTSIPHVR